jgi:hypothetical protein
VNDSNGRARGGAFLPKNFICSSRISL